MPRGIVGGIREGALLRIDILKTLSGLNLSIRENALVVALWVS